MRNFAVKFCLATAPRTEISNESNCVKRNDKFRKNSGIIVQTVRLRIHSAIIGHDRCDITFSFVPEHSRVEPKSSDLVIYPSHFFSIILSRLAKRFVSRVSLHVEKQMELHTQKKTETETKRTKKKKERKNGNGAR